MPGTEKMFVHGAAELEVYFVKEKVALQIRRDPRTDIEVLVAFALSRDEINGLIRKLREARDYSFGPDE
jgi:hypothetical protein